MNKKMAWVYFKSFFILIKAAYAKILKIKYKESVVIISSKAIQLI